MSHAATDDGLPGFDEDRSNNNQDFDHNADSFALHDELVLDDPTESPPPLYSAKEPLKSTSAGSIYDFLDQVELKSAHQLESASSFNSPSRHTLPPLVRTDIWEGLRSSPRGDSAASKPVRPTGSSTSCASSRSDNHFYADIREKVVTLNIELHDKTQTIELLHAARKKDKARAKEKANQAAAEFQAKLQELQARHDKELEKQLDFAQTLGDLVQKCDQLAAELKKAVDRVQQQEEGFQRQLKDAKERWSVQEKVRRDQWMVKKTDEIKKSTIKALEPDVQAIMTKCKENLDKAKEAAADDKRKLIIAHEKEKDDVLRRQREEYERKLVEAREKERSKLMYRLDAADAELQQQLNQQRRRLQDESEKLRADLMQDMRALKQQHARDLDDMRAVERQRIDHELAALQKDKDDMARRFEADAAAYREKVQTETELKQHAAIAAVRAEMEKERAKWEADMIKRRDDKIGMVIDKLQQETEKKVAAAEAKLAAQYDADMREVEKKRRAAAEVETAWMEKNRELYDKCAKLEEAREMAMAAHGQHAAALRAMEDKLARCAQALQEVRDKHKETPTVECDEKEREMHDKARYDGSKHTETLRREYDMEREALRGAVESLQAKLETMEKNHMAYVAEMRGNHDDVLEKLHTRVRSTVAKKDDMIETLREELHLAQVRVAKCEAIINEQRAQLIT